MSADKIIDIIKRTIKKSSGEEPNITLKSRLNEPASWDSINFINVFQNICEEFNIDADDEDAIHFLSVSQIIEFVNSKKR